LGATGAGVGGLLAMKFILSTVLSQCGLKVNWWRFRHIQATGHCAFRCVHSGTGDVTIRPGMAADRAETLVK
jgi:hypothetical protein